MIYEAAMSDAEDKLDTIYRFMVAGFHYGAHVVDFLQEPVVMRMFELKRKVGNEAHFHVEFIRFANMPGDVLVSHIEPKSNVLTLVAPHFSDRLPSENWMIIDDKRLHRCRSSCRSRLLFNNTFKRRNGPAVHSDRRSVY